MPSATGTTLLAPAATSARRNTAQAARGPRPERRVVLQFLRSGAYMVWQQQKGAACNCKRQQKGAALYEYINEPCDKTRHTVCAALRMFDTVARPNQKKAGVCAEERERERKNSARSLIR
eukprot:scaffold112465_cov57-Phaeocystis_antarctica.AAC.1